MDSQHTPLHLVYASDANYVHIVEMAIASACVLASRPNDLIVHVLDCGIPDEMWEAFVNRLTSALSVCPHFVRHVIDMGMFQEASAWHGSLAPYARLKLPSLLPDVEWCVYADGDTLFVSDPFELQACYNPAISIQGHLDPPKARQDTQAWCKERGLRLESPNYICSGFVIMNLRRFRERDLECKCLTLLATYDPVPFVDQGVLNILCDDDKGVLPEGWGVPTPEAFAGQGAKSIHFIGEFGVHPWEPGFLLRKGGYCDAMLAWYACAKALFGRSRYEVSKTPCSVWYVRHFCTRFIKWTVWVLRFFPGLRQRLAPIAGRFAYGKQRRCLATRFWLRAKHDAQVKH